jgi:hypothetical protein
LSVQTASGSKRDACELEINFAPTQA